VKVQISTSLLIRLPPNLLPSDRKTLSEFLVDATWKYQIEPDFQKAVECLHWINRAFFYGVVKENSESLLVKLKEKETQVQRLQEENAKLAEEAEKAATDLVFIQGKYDELDSKFNRIVPKGDTGE
jgi:hypothetical protein